MAMVAVGFSESFAHGAQGAGIWRERRVMPYQMVRLSDTRRGERGHRATGPASEGAGFLGIP